MIVVTVLYPETEGARFDLDYYVKQHIPSHAEDLGVQSWEVLRGIGAPGGGKPDYRVIATLRVSSLEALQTGMEKHGKDIMDDLPNFTDIPPVIQISEMGIPFTDLARLSRTFGPNDSAIWGGVDSYSLLREPVEEQPSCL